MFFRGIFRKHLKAQLIIWNNPPKVKFLIDFGLTDKNLFFATHDNKKPRDYGSIS